MLNKGINKDGQLALFVIFGLLIVVGIIASFLLLPSPEIFNKSSSKNPMQYIQPCISKSLENVIPEYLNKGFYFNPDKTLNYSGEIVAYHCYTDDKNKLCLRNDAQNKARIERELKDKILPEVEKCFLNFQKDNKGHLIEMQETILFLDILPGKININTKKNIEISKPGEESYSYSNFNTYINSPIFDLIRISNEILNEELYCDCLKDSCTANTARFMKNNLGYTVSVYIGGSYDKVYTISNYYKDFQFNFAIKNCDKTP
jgi:hypothetical protein